VSRLVIDASVAVRWVVQLPFSEEAGRLVTFANLLLAPDFIHAEVGNALNNLVIQKALPASEAGLAYEDFCRAPVRLLATRPYALNAFQYAQRHGRSFYDTLYLTLAIQEEATLVTADRKFWNALKDTPLASHIHCLGGGPGRSAR
jgi:predicted nucleic acid-binding protein